MKIKNSKNKRVFIFLILIFLTLYIFPVNAELLKIVCWATPPISSGYANPNNIFTPDRERLTECVQDFGLTEVSDTGPTEVIKECPDRVICCNTRIDQDVTVYVKTFGWIGGAGINVQSQVFPRFSSCGGGSCGYLNDCSGQCNLRSGNSCFDGQTSCNGNSYLTCSGCSWRDNGLVAGQCSVSPNYGQQCNTNACGQPGGTILTNGQCSGPIPALPSGYGNSCSVGTGACQRTGTIQCNGQCSATPGSPTAEICNNNYIDDNCNGETDYDSQDGKHGDSQCSISILSISVSDSNPIENTNLQVTCTSSVGNVNSISAFIDNNLCNWDSGFGWQNNQARFNCNVGAYTGLQKTVKCSVDTAKSYKSGNDQTTTINVIPSSCIGYSSSSVCNNDNRCEWRNECSGTKYSGGTAGCVDKGSFSYTCTKDKCGASCDLTRGGCQTQNCNNLDGCYSGSYRDHSDVSRACIDSCSCSSVSCNQFNSLVTDNDKDGYDTQCDNDCNDNNANINPGKVECCDLTNSVDENCNNQINEICDKDKDGVIDANAPLCQPKTITNYVDVFNQIRQILGIK